MPHERLAFKWIQIERKVFYIKISTGGKLFSPEKPVKGGWGVSPDV